MIILFFGSAYPPNDLGGITLEGQANLDLDLDILTSTKALGVLTLEGSVNLSLGIVVSAIPVTAPLPPRHMIWIYDLLGVRVDVIA
jgi:hypothetical protein